MKMRKKTILSILMLVIACVASGAETKVFMDYHKKSQPGTQTRVDRAPMRLPIEVTCDPDARTITIIGDDTLEAEVYIYDNAGVLVEYSSSLNGIFYISNSGYYTVSIQGDSWYAEGEVEFP